MEWVDDSKRPPREWSTPIRELNDGLPRSSWTSMQRTIDEAWRSGHGAELAKVCADTYNQPTENRLAAAEGLLRMDWYTPRSFNYDEQRGTEECMCVASLRDPDARVRAACVEALALRHEAQNSLAWMPMRVRQTLEIVAIEDRDHHVSQVAGLTMAKADRAVRDAQTFADREEAQEAQRFVREAQSRDHAPELLTQRQELALCAPDLADDR